jgi:hypothetical protein
MGARPTRYFPLSNYQTIIRRNLMLLRRSLMDISSRNGMTFSSGSNSRSEDKMRGSLDHFITALHTLSEHCGYGDMRDQLIRNLIVVGIRCCLGAVFR